MVFWRFMLCMFLICFSYESKAEVFAGYDAFCGLPVVVGTDPQIATARTDAYGNKFIHIDPGAMNNWTMSRVFTLAHECAHHLLGHTEKSVYYSVFMEEQPNKNWRQIVGRH